MRQHVISSLAAAFALASSAAQLLPQVKVGANVQVSKALPNDTHFEMQLAADPFHAERLLACSMLWAKGHDETEVVTYASLDGGRSWTPTLRTQGDDRRQSWDPTCAYGPEGVVYSVSENTNADSKSFDRIDRSTDGGLTWETPTRFKHAERNFVTLDATGGPHNGWIYLQGAGRDCIGGLHCLNPTASYFQYSADGGHTFLSQLVPVAEGDYPIGFGPGVVLSDGTFIFPRGDWKNPTPYAADGLFHPQVNNLTHDGRWANARLDIFRAKFDKANWPLEVEVNTVGDWFYDRPWNGSYLPMMAADASHSPFRDRIYVIWPDVGSGRSQILLAYSSDKGKTWSKPRVIDDTRARVEPGLGPDDIHGEVAVNQEGVVGVTWYDRRDQPDNLGWTVRFRASFDGGETFTPSVRVSETPYRPDKTDPMPLMAIQGLASTQTRLGVHSFHFSGGHTAGLAAGADGVFHALWVGNSTGVPQLWTAPITVAGVVEKNGAADIANFKDVSGKVRLLFSNATLSRSTRMVEADVRLENLSEDTFHGPLKLRVLDLNADLGIPSIVNADAGGTKEGAVFDFTPLLDEGELKPKTTTKPRHIRIRMDELDPIRPFGPVAVVSVAAFNSRVLAESVTGPTKDSPTLKPRQATPSADPLGHGDR